MNFQFVFSVVTHCENKEQDAISVIENDILNSEPCQELVQYCKLGIYCTGAMDADLMKLGLDDLTNGMLSRVVDMRNKLLRKLFTLTATTALPKNWN